MRNMMPIIVGAVVIGGGAIALYNATGGRDTATGQSPPAAATEAVVSPASAGTAAEAPKPEATFAKLDIASDEPILGKTDAPVTIVEYASMTCPHCANFHNTVLPTIKSEFIDKGKVRLVFRDFPLDNLALTASVVARCAGPTRYFPFVDALFASQDKWARDSNPMVALSRIARLGGMSQADFESCLKNQKLTEKVLAQRLDADKTYGVRSTPTIIVNGDLYGGGLGIDQLRAVINSKLK
jgi:protein-disulfide isomerase